MNAPEGAGLLGGLHPQTRLNGSGFAASELKEFTSHDFKSKLTLRVFGTTGAGAILISTSDEVTTSHDVEHLSGSLGVVHLSR